MVGYRKMLPTKISESAYADNIVIDANNERELQYNIEVWKNAPKKRNLKINIDKIKIMIIDKDDENTTIKIDARKKEQVESLKYLGTKIHVRKE